MDVIRDAALKSQSVYTTRLMAEDVCQRLRSKDYLSEIVAINNFVWANTRYMRDPRTVELVQAPYLVTEQLAAGRVPQLDCDDMAAYISALLLSVGCETRVVTVAFRHMYYKGQRQFSHVFAQGKEPVSNTWVTCDSVAGADTPKMIKRVVAAKMWPIA